jgi:hypothetical protein
MLFLNDTGTLNETSFAQAAVCQWFWPASKMSAIHAKDFSHTTSTLNLSLDSFEAPEVDSELAFVFVVTRKTTRGIFDCTTLLVAPLPPKNSFSIALSFAPVSSTQAPAFCQPVRLPASRPAPGCLALLWLRVLKDIGISSVFGKSLLVPSLKTVY